MSKGRYIILFISLGLPLLSQNKKIEKAFQSLSVYNYFDAREKFQQLWIKKQNPYAAYGLSVIYGRSDNPFHQPDSAIQFANRAFLRSHLFRDKKIHGFEISKSSVWNQINHLSLQRWNALKKNGMTLAGLNEFIHRHYLCSPLILEEAFIERMRLISEHCKNIGHPDSTAFYMILYPDEKNTKILNEIYQTQLYDYFTSEKTLSVYYTFIQKYPDHFKRNDALSEIYSICKKDNDTGCWRRLIHTFPKDKIIKKAWMEYFLLFIKMGKKAEEFIIQYPNFPYTDDILQYAGFKNYFMFVHEDSSGVGIIDTNCRELIPHVYDEVVLPSKEGPGWLKKNDTLRFINTNLKFNTDKYYKDTEGFHQLFSAVKNFNDQWFFIFTDGSVVSDTLDKITLTRDFHYIFEKNSRKGIMDINANIRIPAEFDEITPCGNSIYHYRKTNRFGLILPDFKLKTIDAENVAMFRNSFAIAGKNGFYGLINSRGDWILRPEFRTIRQLGENENIFMCFENNQKGIYFNAKEQCTLAAWNSTSDKEQTFLKSGNGIWLTLQPSEIKNQEFIKSDGTKLFPLPQNWELKEPGINFQVICKNKKNEYQIFDLKENKFILRKSALQIFKWNNIYLIINKNQNQKQYVLASPKGHIVFTSNSEIEKLNKQYCKTETEEGIVLFDILNGKKILNVTEADFDSSGNIFVKFKDGKCRVINEDEKNLIFD
jgi:hypothetical protein